MRFVKIELFSINILLISTTVLEKITKPSPFHLMFIYQSMAFSNYLDPMYSSRI